MKNPKHILVTGGEGYIGSSVCSFLLSKKKKIVSIDNLSNSKRSNLKNKIKFYKIDLKDKVKLENLFKLYKFETIIHLAAKIDARLSDIKKSEYYANNFIYGRNLVNIAKKYQAKYLLFASSAAVYGSYKNKFKENDIKKPINSYGKYKLLLENFLLKSNLIHANLRFFNICGANLKLKIGQKNNTGVIKRLCNSGYKKKVFYVYGNDFLTKDGYSVRDYLHIDDLNNIIYKTITHLKSTKKSISINCGTGKGTSIKDLINYYPDKRLKIIIKKKISGDPPEVISSINILKKKLGYKPKYSSIQNIIGTSIKWERFIDKN